MKRADFVSYLFCFLSCRKEHFEKSTDLKIPYKQFPGKITVVISGWTDSIRYYIPEYRETEREFRLYGINKNGDTYLRLVNIFNENSYLTIQTSFLFENFSGKSVAIESDKKNRINWIVSGSLSAGDSCFHQYDGDDNFYNVARTINRDDPIEIPTSFFHKNNQITKEISSVRISGDQFSNCEFRYTYMTNGSFQERKKFAFEIDPGSGDTTIVSTFPPLVLTYPYSNKHPDTPVDILKYATGRDFYFFTDGGYISFIRRVTTAISRFLYDTRVFNAYISVELQKPNFPGGLLSFSYEEGMGGRLVNITVNQKSEKIEEFKFEYN